MRLPLPVPACVRARASTRSGQSLAEFALVLPIMLLLVLAALDFGRIYLGYVNAQQMARIAANYAANNAADLVPPADPAVLDEYRRLVANDARLINCDLPDPSQWVPVFSSGIGLGAPVRVSIPCSFDVLTPIVDIIVGDSVLLTASATFPVKQGAVSSIGGGMPVVPPPITAFLATPRSGFAPLTVSFYDTSENVPTAWVWDFGDLSGPSFDRNPVHTYTAPGTYSVTLTTTNSGGSDTLTRSALILVEERPLTDPVAEFAADVQVGPVPLTVVFTDLSTGSPDTWSWQFGDGGTSTVQNPTHTYTVAGTYDVTLTVTSADGTGTQTKAALVLVSQFPCVVPNFANTRANDAQATWNGAGFTTTVKKLRTGNFRIEYQSLPGGLTNPPNGCAATIEVGP